MPSVKRALRISGIALGLLGSAIVLALGASSALADRPTSDDSYVITIELASPGGVGATEIPPTPLPGSSR